VGSHSPDRRAARFSSGRFLVAPSILILVIQSVVAVAAWPSLRGWSLCHNHVLGGGHIEQAVELALVCGLFGSVALLALRVDPRNVGIALLILAILLSACIALVLLDSAAFVIRTPASGPGGDMLSCPGETRTDSVWFLYPVWGSAVALLLFQAARAFSFRPEPRVERPN
jgi:hypothetical protein